jgi:signal transduction histidine kinase
MKKILLIIYLITQNSLLFANQTDTLTIHENESKLLTHQYFLELEDPAGTYSINDVISNTGFHYINSSLPVLKYSKSITWLKFVLKTIEITDTGVGMSYDVKQRIFEPFFTTKNIGEGTGLGLSIVFGIIEDHKGTIDLQSEHGKSTIFTITLPKNLE